MASDLAASQIEHPIIENPNANSRYVVVCEHASNFMPDDVNQLGLSDADAMSHAAWDPGALPVARTMARQLNAVLVASGYSRLLYDCNRPPEAIDAIAKRSERVEVPGNRDLTDAWRNDRVNRYYRPFQTRLAEVLAARRAPILITMHSFTPVYYGVPRATEIGVLHDRDSRLADALLRSTYKPNSLVVDRNEPYGAEDGVTHTLLEHALPRGLLNVMLEVRNDLIAERAEQDAMAHLLADWIADAAALIETDIPLMSEAS